MSKTNSLTLGVLAFALGAALGLPGRAALAATGSPSVTAAASKSAMTLEQDKALAKDEAPAKFTAPAPDSVAAQLAQTQRETALIEARVAKAKAWADLQKILHPEKKEGGNMAASGLTGAGASVLGAAGHESASPAPSLVVIYGANKHLYATIRLANGVTQDVRVGDAVDGGFTVSKVTVDQVTLVRDGHAINLQTFAQDMSEKPHEASSGQRSARRNVPSAFVPNPGPAPTLPNMGAATPAGSQ